MYIMCSRNIEAAAKHANQIYQILASLCSTRNKKITLYHSQNKLLPESDLFFAHGSVNSIVMILQKECEKSYNPTDKLDQFSNDTVQGIIGSDVNLAIMYHIRCDSLYLKMLEMPIYNSRPSPSTAQASHS
jgi:hypothetical protein